LFLGFLLGVGHIDFFRNNETLLDALIIGIFVYAILFFAFVIFYFKNVKCPNCLNKTKSGKIEQTKTFSAICGKCNIEWNLGTSYLSDGD